MHAGNIFAALTAWLVAHKSGGYMVLRIEEPNVWVESLFVEEAYRRRGVPPPVSAP